MRRTSREDRSIRRLEEIRRHCARPARDTSIAGQVERLANDLDRNRERLTQIVDVWQAHVSPELLERTALAAYRGGTLTIETDSAATAYELNRALRCGLEATLRRASRVNLHRVRVRIGSPDTFRPE